MNYISINKAIKYELSISPNYKWLNDNSCYNVKTGRVIKQVYNSRCIGYIINGKFMSLSKIRALLRKPPIDEYCPF